MDAYRPYVMGGMRTPHNSLVQNAAVPILLVPSQTTLSEFYRSLIPQNGNNDQLSQPRRPSHTVKCGRCGTVHADRNLCPANRRKCYQCHRYGHYAGLCLSRKRHGHFYSDEDSDAESEDSFVSAASVNANQRLTELQSALEDSTRQNASIKEDMINLRAQCESLKVTNRTLSEDLKNLQVAKAEVNSQSEENVKLNQKLSKANQDLICELDDSEMQVKAVMDENERLKNQIKNLNDTNQKFENDLKAFKKSKSELKSFKTENVKLKTECTKLSVANQKLESDLQSLLSSDKEAKESIESLKKNNEMLFTLWIDVELCLFKQLVEKGKLQNEIEALVDFEYRQTGNQPCQKCGSCIRHAWHSCPAKDWDCKCQQKGHFLSVCQDRDKDEWYETDAETKKLLQSLEELTGIKSNQTKIQEQCRQDSDFENQC